jgi:hypothetical protein
MVWKNPYRDEFTRHGTVEYPSYPQREAINFTFGGGTWSGQTDRAIPIELSTTKA